MKAPRNNRDNDFDDQKKNKRNNLTHCGLWDNETWEVTELGYKFLKRIEEGSDPLEEMGILHVGVGRYGELIGDIKKIQETINKDNQHQFLADLKRSFVRRGYIGLNPKKAEKNTREFLRSERQIHDKIQTF